MIHLDIFDILFIFNSPSLSQTHSRDVINDKIWKILQQNLKTRLEFLSPLKNREYFLHFFINKYLIMDDLLELFDPLTIDKDRFDKSNNDWKTSLLNNLSSTVDDLRDEITRTIKLRSYYVCKRDY